MIQQNPKFLIVKTSALGDIIHTFPVISYLKNKFPTCEIDWVVEGKFSEVLLANKGIDRVFTIHSKEWKSSFFTKKTRALLRAFRKEIRSKKYDYAFDLQGNVKSGFVMHFARANEKIGFGRQTVPEWPNLFFTNKKFNPPPHKNIREDYLFIVKSALEEKENTSYSTHISLEISEKERKSIDILLETLPKPLILICPGTRWPNKELSQENLQIVLENLIQTHDPFFLFSYGNEKERGVSISLQNKIQKSFLLPPLTIPVLHYLMSLVDLVVAMDSLPLHLCGTTKTKTVSFFGPSSSAKYRPLGEGHLSLDGKCPYNKFFEKRCPLLRTCPTGACLKDFSKESIDVFCKSIDLKT